MVSVNFYGGHVKSVRRTKEFPQQVEIVLTDDSRIVVFDENHVIPVKDGEVKTVE